MITPGSTIGILGGGQLGRMLILAGRALGYRFHVFEPSGPSPAGMIADDEVNAPYSDEAALRAFAESVDIITLEFENIPAEVIDSLNAIKPVMPGKQVLHICQHRQREKDFLKESNLPLRAIRICRLRRKSEDRDRRDRLPVRDQDSRLRLRWQRPDQAQRST